MKITFLELRRDPGKLLEALERNEEITISRRGQDIARVIPTSQNQNDVDIAQHPAFGIWADREDMRDPSEWVRQVRKGRFHDL